MNLNAVSEAIKLCDEAAAEVSAQLKQMVFPKSRCILLVS